MRRTTRAAQAACLVLVLAAGGLSAWASGDVPDPMVTHWSAAGQADDTLPREVALAGGPALAAAVGLLLFGMARLDPLRENIRAFRAWYDGAAVLVVAFVVYAHAVVVAWNLGWSLDVRRALAPALAAMLAFSGLAARRAERNWVVGFRTPWTMSDERVWRWTHDRGGLLLVVSAGFALLGVVWPDLLGWLVGVPLALTAVFATVGSLWRYRRLEAGGEAEPEELGP